MRSDKIEIANTRRRKIAILLPNGWRGGMLRNAFALARLLTGHEWRGIGKIDVVIGLRRDGAYDWEKIDRDLVNTQRAITVRKTEWKNWPTESLQLWFRSPAPVPDAVKQVLVPYDRAHNFLDCEAWIIFGGYMLGYLAAPRPCAVYCPDLIQRYVPAIFDSLDGKEQVWLWNTQTITLLAWRNSRCVFATTPQTLRDAVEYAGIPSHKAILVPTLVDALGEEQTSSAPPAALQSIIWVTNPTVHKNHSMAVAAMQIYYEDLGGKLPLVAVGPNTDAFDPQLGIDCAASRAFKRTPSVLRRTRFAGEVSDAEYLKLIGGAGIVWHNVIMDNGSFVAIDAARAGRHFVSSDYPQIRYLCERYGVATTWHPPCDPMAAAQALLHAERELAAGKRPSHHLRDDGEHERVAGYEMLLRKLFEAENGFSAS